MMRTTRTVGQRLETAARWAALFLFVAALGCNRHAKEGPTGGSSVPPSKTNLKRNVELSRAEQRALVYYVETVGVLEAENETDIHAGVSGIVDEVLFREGDEVDASTMLVKIDQRRYVANVKLAEANVQRADANVKVTAANLQRADANLQMANDLAQRAQQAGVGASAEERAKSMLALRGAEAELLSARAQPGIAAAELESAKASLDLAQHNLSRSQVRAPYKGRLNQRRISPGTFVEDKTVIATIANLSRVRLIGYVPETAAPVVRELMAHQDARQRANRLSLGVGGWFAGPFAGAGDLWLVVNEQVPSGFDPEFQLLVFPQRLLRARLFYLSTTANRDTHMFEFKAEIDLRGLDLELKPGYTARIRIPLRSSPNAVVVPEEAVRASEQGFIAFVPADRTGRDGKPEQYARARPLEIGYRTPGWVEVRRGITPGEWIVRRGAEALENGTPINVVPPGGRK